MHAFCHTQPRAPHSYSLIGVPQRTFQPSPGSGQVLSALVSNSGAGSSFPLAAGSHGSLIIPQKLPWPSLASSRAQQARALSTACNSSLPFDSFCGHRDGKLFSELSCTFHMCLPILHSMATYWDRGGAAKLDSSEEP